MSVDLWFTSLDSGISRQCSFKDGFCYLLKYAGFIIGYLFVSIFCIFWHVLRIWKNWFDSKDRLMSCSVSFDFLNAGLARDSTMVSGEWISNFFFLLWRPGGFPGQIGCWLSLAFFVLCHMVEVINV